MVDATAARYLAEGEEAEQPEDDDDEKTAEGSTGVAGRKHPRQKTPAEVEAAEAKLAKKLGAGDYVAGVGVVDAAAAARVAVAHTLAALGSGRYKKEGWGADAAGEDPEEEEDDDPSVTGKKHRRAQRKERKAAAVAAAGGHVAQKQKRPGVLKHLKVGGKAARSSVALSNKACGMGPAAVAVHHALVYCAGWSVVIGIRLHFFPRVFMCFTPVWPALPFCDAEPDLFGYNVTATTSDLLINATILDGGYWVRGPPGLAGLFDDVTLTGGSAPDPAFLCWLWSRLRLFHLPSLACLQAAVRLAACCRCLLLAACHSQTFSSSTC